MLIAFVSMSAWAVYNFRLDTIRALLADGHTILVIAGNDAFAPKLEAAGCRFIPLPYDNRSRNLLADLRFYSRLKKTYAREKPDLVFHYAIKANIYGSHAAAAVGIPSIAVVTGLGYPFSKKNLVYHIVRRLYSRMAKKAREIWFLNKEDASFFLQQRIAPAAKLHILPGEGINTDYFRPGAVTATPNPKPQTPNPRPLRFILCSRLLKSKGIAHYAAACTILRRRGFDFDAVLLGFYEKNHPDGIQPAQIRKWEEEGVIRFLGFAEDVRPHLDAADVYVFCSYYNEGVPRSLMEAASMELPVIAPRLRGCKELLVDGETGWLTHPGDPVDLAEKMEKMLLLDPATRAEMGRRGRLLMESQFSVERILGSYRAIIAAVGSEKRKDATLRQPVGEGPALQ